MSQYDDDFWSDGSESTGEADLSGGIFDPVPNGTKCLLHVEDVEWGFFNKEGTGTECIKPVFCVESPSDYENRKLQCNIKWYGDDPNSDYYDESKQEKTKENARKIFWAIDKNCGGKLAALGKRPSNRDLANAWIGARKSFYITFGLMDGSKRNWIRKVEPLNAGNSQQQSKSVQKRMETQKPQQKNASSNFDDDDDDIPF